MIFVFSATGNSQYVASQIAAENKESIFSIVDCIEREQYVFDPKDERIGIVVPTYAWGLPSIVTEFLERLRFTSAPRIYFVATYGTTPGHSGYFADRILQKNGYYIDTFFSVKMPDTWTPTFDLSDKERVSGINRKAEAEINTIINALRQGKTGDYMKDRVPKFTRAFCRPLYDRMRKTKNFCVEDRCIGCGLCAKRCPAGVIQMIEGKPVWTKDRCIMCLGCLHRCPRFSIQYGKNTKKHGQYQHPTKPEV